MIVNLREHHTALKMSKNEKFINHVIHDKNEWWSFNDKIAMYKNNYNGRLSYVIYKEYTYVHLVRTECTIELKECLDMIDFLGECYD